MGSTAYTELNMECSFCIMGALFFSGSDLHSDGTPKGTDVFIDRSSFLKKCSCVLDCQWPLEPTRNVFSWKVFSEMTLYPKLTN